MPRRPARRLVYFLLLLVAAGCQARHAIEPTVILVSLDGFRPDYQARFDTPNLDRLTREGVHAEGGMIPVFPTKTFPNHYSIATGLYPAHHGIVGNTIYDPDMDSWFRISDREAVEDSRWWLGEPIWVTAEKQGMTAGTFFWPGSEAPVDGVQATYWKRFDAGIPARDRIDEVVHWLELPESERPRLVTLYFADTDHAGHDHGPDSDDVREAVETVDANIGLLMSELETRGLLDRINLIVVSDHGMVDVSPDRAVFVEDYFDVGESRISEYSPVLMIEPGEGRRDEIEAAVDRMPHVARYDETALDTLFHFTGSPRIPSVVAVVDPGWTIVSSREYLESRRDRFPHGMHGFDPRDPSMAALFVARGPAFREGVSVEPFENVDIYPLVAHILGLEPADVDGTLDDVRGVLR